MTIVDCTLPDQFTVSGTVDTSKGRTSTSFLLDLQFTSKEEYCVVGQEIFESLIPTILYDNIITQQYDKSKITKQGTNRLYLNWHNENQEQTNTQLKYSKKSSISTYSISIDNHTNSTHDTTNNHDNHKHNDSILSFCQYVFMFISIPTLLFNMIIVQKQN